MFWGFAANVVLPFGVIILLAMTLPLHHTLLRQPVQKLVTGLMQIQFFNLKIFGEPITAFHVIIAWSFSAFMLLLNPWGSREYEKHHYEDILHKSGRWRRERNMYIASFIFIVYYMIYGYHKLRTKYDKLKRQNKQAKSD